MRTTAHFPRACAATGLSLWSCKDRGLAHVERGTARYKRRPWKWARFLSYGTMPVSSDRQGSIQAMCRLFGLRAGAANHCSGIAGPLIWRPSARNGIVSRQALAGTLRHHAKGGIPLFCSTCPAVLFSTGQSYLHLCTGCVYCLSSLPANEERGTLFIRQRNMVEPAAKG